MVGCGNTDESEKKTTTKEETTTTTIATTTTTVTTTEQEETTTTTEPEVPKELINLDDGILKIVDSEVIDCYEFAEGEIVILPF